MVALQRLVGNSAVQQVLPKAMATQGSVPENFQFTIKDRDLGKKKNYGYFELGAKWGATFDCEVSPPAGDSAAPGVEVSHLLSPTKPREGEGGTKVSGGRSAEGLALKVQAEVAHEFDKRGEGWLEFVPKLKLGGEAGAEGGYKLALEGSIEHQRVEPKFGFTLFDVDEKGEIKFAETEAALEIKLLTYTHTRSDGTTLQISAKPVIKLVLAPDKIKILEWVIKHIAAKVTASTLIVGGFILGGLFAVVGFLMTLGHGKTYARVIDEASRFRTNYVLGFIGEITGSGSSTADDFGRAGKQRGAEWLGKLAQDLGAGGVSVPSFVITEKARERKAEAQAEAERAVNAYLNRWLVKQYWEVHYIRKRLPYYLGGYIDKTFLRLMDEQGFGRPKETDRGEDAVEGVVVPGS